MPDHPSNHQLRRDCNRSRVARIAVPMGLGCLIWLSGFCDHSAARAHGTQSSKAAIQVGQFVPVAGEELPALPLLPHVSPGWEPGSAGDEAGPEQSYFEHSPSAPAAACDDIWLIDTRHPTPQNPQPQFSRLQCGQWNSGDEAGFVSANQDGVPLCVWIHGYQISAAVAQRMGLEIYRELRRTSPPCTKFRFVIWSWPSVKTGPCRIDARRKARRSDVEGFKLARVIEKLPTEVPVGLLGFSYGSRLTGSTLHFLGGGTLAGLPPVASSAGANGRSIRAVLLAGALDCDSFTPQGLNSSALSAADCILVLRNQHDPVLLAYRHLEEFAGNPAMGKVGPAPASNTEPLVVWNVSSDIRVSHDWRDYVGNPRIFAPIASLVLFADRGHTAGRACQTAAATPPAPSATSAPQPQAVTH